jgi:hypothetical protein
MTRKAFCALTLFAVSVLAGPIYKDGVLVGGIEKSRRLRLTFGSEPHQA